MQGRGFGSAALRETCVGLLLMTGAAAVLERTTEAWAAKPRHVEHRAAEPGGVEQSAAEQTPLPSTPPLRIGPDYDDDRALPEKADSIASYSISAALDATAHLVHARGVIRFRNASTEAVRELWLHLYLNAFKNDQTLFLRSPFGAGRSGARAKDWGYIDVKKLAAREFGSRDLWPGADKFSPNEPNDQTDIRVPLPAPLQSGGSLTLDVEFDAKLPEILERTGYSGSFHFVAQWFPKLAKLEPNGTWVHFPFHAQSEFYADYGEYDVELDVPSDFVVGATGQRVGERLNGSRRILEYRASNVHDFAWTAWDRFQERRERIASIDVRLLYPPGFDVSRDRTFEALRFALPHFNALYGRYPYPVLTVVHPPEDGSSAGGMEYPTLITTGGPWYMPLTRVRSLESVTIHELGHQWFYGLVATDEHAWPFLDEGLNSYAELEALESAYGAGSLFDGPGLTISGESGHRVLAALKAEDEPVAGPAARFENFDALGSLVYSRTATILRTLENVYGRDNLRRALGRYARFYRFAHPSPKHFLAAMRDVLGDEATRMLELALFERGTVDYLIGDIVNARDEKPAGIFDRKSGRETVMRDMNLRAQNFTGRVSVHRHGSLQFPVDVELLAEDGTAQRRHWDGRGIWAAFDYTGKSPLLAARVDPEHRILLDDDLLNNSKTTSTPHVPRVIERACYAAELLIAALGP